MELFMRGLRIRRDGLVIKFRGSPDVLRDAHDEVKRRAAIFRELLPARVVYVPPRLVDALRGGTRASYYGACEHCDGEMSPHRGGACPLCEAAIRMARGLSATRA